ncbi:TCR/Tet family MFS transporter [Rhodobacteraceae bacterium N5(2021)]|uniref:TCR/Tet family MFS transporter n=1 Tax=Gymnodinialimonas phycosphaerae TaxID=2841589 RepID=A0A975YGB2_9RHOB|nr:TCR/Tet family MFS transporter [Gymnodinialimonas phycosphaerae]MBY4891480.1 TCR/Tet family MFS transporter [Gymnodinialimonas phycosphaerae]
MRLPTLFILITVTIDAMGIGLILPVMPALITEVRGADLANAALWGGVLSSTYAVMQFLCSPTLGNLSDRFGRRPILLVSLAVLSADYVVMSLAGTIWLLIIGRIIAGIAAGTHATALAYMADITAPEKRAQNFGLISAGFGMGFVLGPLVAAFLGDIDPRAPFVAAACLAAANFAFGYFILPESLPRNRRRPFQWRRANPAGGLMQISALPGVRLLLVVMLAYQIANFVYPAIWAYYGQAAFGWTSRMVGLSLTVYGVAIAVVQAGLIRLILPRLGLRRTVYWGLVLNSVCLICYGLASDAWMIWVLIPISAMGAVVAPAMQGVMSQAAGADQQGELQGVLASISSLSMILSPLIMTQAFFWFTREGATLWLPGAPFLLAAVLMGAAFAIFATLHGRSGGTMQEASAPQNGDA